MFYASRTARPHTRGKALQRFSLLVLTLIVACSLVPSAAFADGAIEGNVAPDAPSVEGSAYSEKSAVSGSDPVAALDEEPAPNPVADEASGSSAGELVGSAEESSLEPVLQSDEPDTTENTSVMVPQSDELTVTVKVVGVDAAGSDETWGSLTEFKVSTGSKVDTLSETAFDAFGLTRDSGTGTWGYYLNTITSPDGTRTLGWDAESGKYWQFFVNGVASEYGAGQVTLNAGDSILWYYSAYGASAPETAGGITVDPGADHPDKGADWPGFAGGSASGASTSAATPVEKAEAAEWTTTLKESNQWSTYLSDPIVVGGDLYVVVGNELRRLSAADGSLIDSTSLAATINSVSRMAACDGIIVVPLANGQLQAIAADSLTTLWISDALPAGDKQQSLGNLVIDGGYVYYATSNSNAKSGYLRCLNLTTGALRWSDKNATSGYYWGGAVRAGSYIVSVDDAGLLATRNPETGAIVSSITITGGVRAAITVSDDGHTLFVTSKDGVLHKVAVADNGGLLELSSVQFGDYSTSTSTLVDGKIYVAGRSEETYVNDKGRAVKRGVLAVIDTLTMTVEHSITTTDDGYLPAESKAAPLVSTQADGTYVYFTCNSTPGGLYSYKVGEEAATVLFTPETAFQNYCMANVICDADGNLYYTNDSGALFKLAHRSTVTPPDPDPDPSPAPDPGPAPAPGGGDSGSGSGASTGSGTSSVPVSRVTTTVAATHTALASGTDTTGTDTAGAPAVQATSNATVTSAATGARGAASTPSTTSVDADAVPATQVVDVTNPWPWMGLGAGIAVLLGALIYLIAGRRGKRNEA